MLGMRSGKVAIINRPNFAAGVFPDFPSPADPFRAQRRQTLFDVAMKIRIAPRAAGVVNAHRLVDFDLAANRFRWGERYLPKRNSDVFVQRARDINLLRVRQSRSIIHRFETRSFPNSLAAFPCGFSFYVADPLSSIRRFSQITSV